MDGGRWLELAALCFFDVQSPDPCAIQCLRQICRLQSSAIRVCPQPWIGHREGTGPAGRVRGAGRKVGVDMEGGDALGDLLPPGAKCMNTHCSP